MKKFLVVIDTQYDFVMPNGALYVKNAEEIVLPGITFLANLKPEDYEGVLFTFDSHLPEVYNGSAESELFPIHCVQGTPGWENVFNKELVHRDIKTWTLNKGVFNMWKEPHLEMFQQAWMGDVDQSILEPRDSFFLKLKANGIDTIEMFGVASDFCVKWAVDGFEKRGFKVKVLSDMCRGINLTARETFEDREVYPNVEVL